MKKMIISVIGVLILLSGCSTTSTTNEHHKHPPGNSQGITAVEVLLVSKESSKSLLFYLKNQTESAQTYTFSSSKIFSYKVYDSDEKLIIDSNDGKMYTQALKDITLKQGEEFKLGGFSYEELKPGSYTIKVISEPMKSKPFELKKEFKVN